jgi:hypothetical protein
MHAVLRARTSHANDQFRRLANSLIITIPVPQGDGDFQTLASLIAPRYVPALGSFLFAVLLTLLALLTLLTLLALPTLLTLLALLTLALLALLTASLSLTIDVL